MTTDEVRRLLFEYVNRPQPHGGVVLDCTNHRGERSVRTVLPVYGSLRQLHPSDPETKWHPAGMAVFDVYDVAKEANRTFACEDIHSWKVIEGDAE